MDSSELDGLGVVSSDIATDNNVLESIDDLDVSEVSKVTHIPAIRVIEVADRRLDNLYPADILPIDRINKMFKAPLVHKISGTIDIDVYDTNTSVYRSMAVMSEKLGFKYNFDFMDAMFDAGLLNKINIDLKRLGINCEIPNNQICFSAGFGEIECYRIHLSEVFANELFIVCATFNGDQMVKASARDLVSLFGDIFDRIESYAQYVGYNQISIIAPESGEKKFISKFGFELENSKAGDSAKNKKSDFPMIKKLPLADFDNLYVDGRDRKV